MTSKQIAKDKRLQKKYGITLANRDARIKEQGGKCKCCGGPLDRYGPPHTDHFHFPIKAFRATTISDGIKWYAQAYDERGCVICVKRSRTKQAAIQDAKKAMLAWSVRGILCGKCNRGLGYIERFFDAAAHPENLLLVIAYLKSRLT